MIEQGLVDEVQKLKNMGFHRDMVSMQGLGYKEILDYLDGKTTLEEAIYIIKRETRHFAKRQLTWFRRERDVIWLDKQVYDYQDAKILDSMINILKEKTIIKNIEKEIQELKRISDQPRYILYSFDKFDTLYSQREWWMLANAYGANIEKFNQAYPLVYHDDGVYIWKVR